MTDGQSVLRGCPSFETLNLYFDNELSPTEIELVSAHVDQCGDCTATLRDLSLLKRALISTTPATSRRTIRLTEADVEGDRPAIRLLEPAAPFPATRQQRLLTIPFAPALAAIAALLLIAVIAGDFISRDNGPDVFVVPGGTEIAVTEQDLEDSSQAASSDPVNDSAVDGSSGQADRDDGFWDWWRAAEILLIAVLAGLLTTIFLQRRSQMP